MSTTTRWRLLGPDEEQRGTDAGGLIASHGELQARHDRFASGPSGQVDQIDIGNGKFQLSILPTRGMGIHEAICSDGLRLGWNSPVNGPVHPSLVPLFDPSGLGWLEGFDELLCRCGLTSNGAPDFDDDGKLIYPLHGRIANLPARQVELVIDRDNEVMTLTGHVDEIRFHFQKLRLTSQYVLRAGTSFVDITDTITNLSASEAESQLLYHINFGPPLLGEGSRFIGPIRRLMPRTDLAADQLERWDRYVDGVAGAAETVYFATLQADTEGQTQVMLVDPTASRSAYLQFSTAQLPCFTLWKNETALEDGYVTGLEPGTNYPNPRQFEGHHGRVVKLAPGASHSVNLRLGFDANEDKVAARIRTIESLAAAPTEIVTRPEPDWCSG